MPIQIPINTPQFYVKIHGSSSHRRGFFVVLIGILTRSERPTNFSGPRSLTNRARINLLKKMSEKASRCWRVGGGKIQGCSIMAPMAAVAESQEETNIYCSSDSIVGMCWEQAWTYGLERNSLIQVLHHFTQKHKENNWNTWGFNLI